MKPVNFPHANVTLAKHQPEYIELPAWRSADNEEFVTCWKLSWWERIRLLITGELWLRQLTLGNAFQPQLPQVDVPPMEPDLGG